MIRLVWLVAGFVGGLVVARNAPAMPHPAVGALLLCMVVGCGVCWWAGYRGKSSAVATAVATAVASAEASAEARAQAIAQQAVSVYIGRAGGGVAEPVPPRVPAGGELTPSGLLVIERRGPRPQLPPASSVVDGAVPVPGAASS